jgi:hydrophobe/amphiphile efflux-1 (HAE1) family protein
MFSRIFIERPRMAMVISIIVALAGVLALLNIPIAQYPQITPPEIRVSATYPGANAQVVADSVAAPLEAEINGVEDMLYMVSTSSNDGGYNLSVTFAVGTDPDIAQVNVQNRVQQATAKLPGEVTEQGISVRTRSSDMLAVISFFSPEGSRDVLFLSNYVSINVKDALTRIKGVSEGFIFGAKDYSMRVWMDPERLTSLGLTADDVVTAIRQQNIQAAAGAIGTAPGKETQQVQFTLRAEGRLKDVADFRDIVVETNAQGGVVRLKDVARVELGAQSYSSSSTLNGSPAVNMAIYRSAGANALETVQAIEAELKRLSQRFPEDVQYRSVYDTTKYVRSAIREIALTLMITFSLVVAVTFLFLQDWRATLIPVLTIPVSLVGTFAALLALGMTANTITLFALILAIGVVSTTPSWWSKTPSG